MKNFTKKSILQKIIIAIIVTLLLSNFIVPTYSHAGVVSTIGGTIFNAVTDLIVIVVDGIETLLQYFMLNDMANGEKLRDVDIMVQAEEAESKGLTTSESADIIIEKDELDLGWNADKDTYRVPNLKYTPEEIFTGNTPFLQINFISPESAKDSQGNDVEGISQSLHKTIASWYVALRNLALVGLLVVLVYVGIRIILSSTAADKAKYKQLFTDWLIAICLLFFLHYIMSFTLTLTKSVTEALAGNDKDTSMVIEVTGDKSYKTNIMGAARFQTQSNDNVERISYLIVYVILVGYTIIFTIMYLKRTLMMAFLTIMAPLVALTYPIDKMNDGQAQAFNTWLKEYVFNALLQPFHLIIYYVFVMSAVDLASNPIYVIAVMLFILPAEKILRNFFGFNKAGAGTVSALTGFTAGSMAQKFLNGKKSSGGNSNASADKPPRTSSGNVGAGDINPDELLNSGQDQGNIEEQGDSSNNNYNVFPDDDMANYYNNHDDGLDEERSIDDRMREIEDNDMMGYQGNPEWIALNEQKQRQEYERQQREQERQMQEQQRQMQEQQRTEEEQQNDKNKKSKGKSKIANWARGHGGAKHIAGKVIKGAAKFGTKTAFTIAGGTAGAVLGVASGKGLAGMGAGIVAGGSVGNKLGGGVINVAAKVEKGGRRFDEAVIQLRKGDTEKAKDALIAGTRLGEELDLANGNKRYQEAAEIRDFKKDENNIKIVREKWAKEHNGVAPTSKELNEKIDSLEKYLKSGITDINDMLKLQQKAKEYGIDDNLSAQIAGLTKKYKIEASDLRDKNKAEARRQDIIKDYKDAGHEKIAEKLADRTMEIMKLQNDVASSYTKRKK